MAEGHRARLRKRFEEENIDTIPDYMVIEKMLNSTVARKATTEIARELIKQFGGIPQIIDAPAEELKRIPGLGDEAISNLKLLPSFYRRYQLDKWGKAIIFDSAIKAVKFLKDKFIGYNTEIVIVLCMDANGKMIVCRPVFEGSVNTVEISIKNIVQCAVSFNASRVILAHNHIHGDATPSIEDVLSTKTIYEALKLVGVKLDDHFVISGEDYVSIRQSGGMDYVGE